MRYKPDDIVCGWRLLEVLGSGGNGEVWKAVRLESVAALKILHCSRLDSEPYKRFVNETTVLQQLELRPGVLPMKDFHLPPNPSKNNPPWLSMPIAIPIRRAMPTEAPLTTAVQAVQSIANTLAELAGSRGLHHRDIKPENLYLYEDRWCIGDFGLVDVPHDESLTEVGQLLGARHYLAPELYKSYNTSWASADLYALAKTLWVLVTGQRYPPPGQLVHDVDYFRLSTYIQANDAVRFLERLIERSTHPTPTARTSLAEFFKELMAWMTPHSPVALPSPEDAIKERIRSAVLSNQDVESGRARLRTYVNDRLTALRNKLAGLGTIVQSLTTLTPEFGSFTELESNSRVSALRHLPDSYHVGTIGCRVTSPLRRRSGLATHCAGIALCVTASGVLHMLALHILTSSHQARVVTIWTQEASAHMDSLLEFQAIGQLVSGLEAQAPQALDAFAHLLRES